MNASYFVRMFLLSGEVFFLIYFSLGFLMKLAIPRLVRRAENWHPNRAANVMAWLRLIPALGSAAALSVCMPAYLLLEEEAGMERAGWLCLVLASASFSIFLTSAFKSLMALLKSRNYVRQCGALAQKGSGVWVIPGESPFLAVAGLLRPRYIASKKLIELFPEEELRLALRHETAHTLNRDNWKRLLFVASPAFPGSKSLELAWHHFAELSADDFAVAGDANSGVILASALVRAAKYNAAPVPCLLASYFITRKEELTARVNRLLNAEVLAAPAEESDLSVLWFGAILACFILFACATQIESIHRLLESSFR